MDNYRTAGGPTVSAATEAHYRQAVEKALDAMHRNVGNEFTIEDMAAEVYISPFHFHRIFRRTVGIPPAHFLSALRFQSAKRLLVETEDKVVDICSEVGFNSVGTFSRRFKELVGLSPNNLRRAVTARRDFAAVPIRDKAPLGPAAAAGLTGRVTAPSGFRGQVFIGLFESPLPEGPPASCCVLPEPGSFRLAPVADGSYYCLAAGYRERSDHQALLLGEAALRGGSIRRPVRVRGGRWKRQVIELRPPKLTDPPILVALPLLSELMRERQRARS